MDELAKRSSINICTHQKKLGNKCDFTLSNFK